MCEADAARTIAEHDAIDDGLVCGFPARQPYRTFPLPVQVRLNGRQWLERKLTARGIDHAKIDHVCIRFGVAVCTACTACPTAASDRS